MSTFGERLVGGYHSRVQGYVRMRVPEQDREDVVSEIFVEAIEHQNELRGDLGAWLFGLARRRVARYYRQRNTAMRAQDEAAAPPLPTPVSPPSLEPLARLEAAEFSARLQRQMRILSERERDVIALKFTQGLTNTQIAELLDLDPNHLGVLLHRALRQLRDAMLQERT